MIEGRRGAKFCPPDAVCGKRVPGGGRGLTSHDFEWLDEQHGGEAAVPFVIGIPVFLDIAGRAIDALRGQVEGVSFICGELTTRGWPR